MSQGGRRETNAKRIGFFNGLSGGDAGGSVYVPLGGVVSETGNTGNRGMEGAVFCDDVDVKDDLSGEVGCSGTLGEVV